MCVIVDFSGEPVPRTDVEQMAAAAPYRARDGGGYWGCDGVAFLYQAMNVTPESARERQPFVDRATALVVMADARVDNRSELLEAVRPMEPSGGAKGEAPTDLDIIAAACARWGDAAAPRIIGDYAIVTWDPKRRRLFAARDPMGMRPLAYRWDGRRLVLASEVQQVLSAPGVPLKLFEPAIAAHLLGDHEHRAWTPYEDIFLLLPGHALVVDGRNLAVARTWEYDPDRRLRLRSESDHVEAFRTLFGQAVDARLRCRQGIGVMLSGGVDSGCVASMAGALVRRRGDDPAAVRTYSWAFEELVAVDERHISDRIVSEYGFTPVRIEADERWPLRDYPAHGPSRNEPFCGAYQALIEHALGRAREDGVGVLLWGLRGDVLVGASVFDTLGLVLNGRWRAVAGELQAYRKWRRGSFGSAARRLLLAPAISAVAATPWGSRLRRRKRVQPREPPPWVRPELLAHAHMSDSTAAETSTPRGFRDAARQRRHDAVFAGIVATGMDWGERMHAEVGLGFADPWSDRRLAEFVIGAPQWMVNRVQEPKHLAREAMRGIMPESVRREATKILPNPLYHRALEERAVAVIDDLLRAPLAEAMGFVDGETLREHYAAVRRGSSSHSGLWPALTLEMWLRAHHEACD